MQSRGKDGNIQSITNIKVYNRGMEFYILTMDNPTAIRASLVAQTVKNPPAVWETWVSSLGWEDPLEEGMATPHSSILAWRIPRTEEPGGHQAIGLQRVRYR